MVGYHTEIESKTLQNEYFREVLFTGKKCQLVLMNLKPGEDIGVEVHGDTDQFFRVESGEGKAILDGQEYELKDGVALIVPAGTEHNLLNTSSTEPLKMYTLYSPPNHPDGTVHKTKAEADAYEEAQHHH
jgi:mannose-6-phosphate isomerase-like protein (cupin superfamily)